ncbi:alpha/beta hydrolase [Arachnia rubra]|uniref:alpha/beta hydrolase n=1 Tax=Arachnia rubra TaxID=1547448 RepID=UPI001CC66E94|nr:alpha/beta hydrolase [Arachnia rubra]BCR80203.1 lysophospholipase [Arachnia rubra]
MTWVSDVQLPGYQQLDIPLPEAGVYPGEPEHEVVATLVRRSEPTSRSAVLYVHGWSDYFFQTHLADAFAGWGYDFYALDLRRYGRSLRQGQLAGYTADFTEYYQELDAAVEVIRAEGYESLVLMGHSTGGLAVSLYVHARPGVADVVVLNSPWLELQSLQAWRPALAAAFSAVGTLSPTRAVVLPDPGFYLRSISADEDGQWDYNPNLKGDPAFLPRVGWLSAVMRGHAAVAAGLGIDVPVLMLISTRSDFSRTWNDDMHRADLVLDVDALAARAPQLGRHVTLIRIERGKHDLVLSEEEPRERFLDEVRRWLDAYA